jgi:uncharacterized protein YdeI (YjbR/CyaY-like superfamily)
MAAMTNPKVDSFFAEATQWPAELQQLRTILRDTPLTEELKWRQPCYSYDGGNVVILGEFKDGCRMTFFKGALLKDPDGLLDLPGENSHVGRILRFTDADSIDESVVRGFVQQGIEIEKAGLQVDTEDRPDVDLPDELLDAFNEVEGLQDAFEALTPGRQRGYLLHFADAKKSETRAARIEKYVPKIFEGKGMHDR